MFDGSLMLAGTAVAALTCLLCWCVVLLRRRRIVSAAGGPMSLHMAETRTSTRSDSRTTTDHDEIRAWVDARGGRPATVRGTGEEKLEPTSWDE